MTQVFFCVLKPIEFKKRVTRELWINSKSFDLGGIMPHFDGVVAVTSLVVLEPGDYSVFPP